MRTSLRCVSIAAAFAFFLLPAVAHGAVVHCGPGNVGCLIAAMEAANANGRPTLILLASGTYSLVQPHTVNPAVGLPPVVGSIAIVGAARDATIIEGVPPDPQTFFGFLQVQAPGELVLARLTLRNGNAGFGTPVANSGSLAIRDVTFDRTIAFSVGAISNDGSMSIADSEIRGSIVTLAGGGCCAIFNRGRMEIVRSLVHGNGGADSSGGAVANTGELLVTESAIRDNAHDITGGIDNNGELRVVRSSIANNSTGAAGRASALANRFPGRATIEATTIIGSRDEAAISVVWNESEMSLLNVTVTLGPQLSNVTSPLLRSSAGGVATLQNSILARPADPGPICQGAVTSLGHNIIESTAGCTITLAPSDKTGDPGFGVPVGGVVPLLATSQAIDAGDASTCPALDQRGLPRVDGNRDGVVVCDIGATEFIEHIARVALRFAGVFQPRGKKLIGVDIFGGAAVGGDEIDAATVRAGATGYEASPKGRPRLLDVDGDGNVDLRLAFRVFELGLSCDAPNVAVTAKTISGETVAGTATIAIASHICRGDGER
jgi:hypothetical protein